MEFTVLDAQNTPKKPVIVVRVGTALRHAELALNTPFHVPSRGQEDSTVKVSLYEQLGTQTIPDADEPESMCNVPVRAPDGRCTQVKLRIRRGKDQSLADAKRSQVGVEAYLNTHQLEARLQSLFEIVLKKQPQDPYRCMIEELQKARDPGSGGQRTDAADASAATIPKAPVAPAEPPPKNARPSPHVKPSSESEKPASSKPLTQEEEDTKKALAQFLGSNKESSSLGGAREQARSEAVKAMGTSAMAAEVTKHIMRRCSDLDPGERIEIHKAARCCLYMVVRGANTRIQASCLGLMSGGRSSTVDYMAPSHDATYMAARLEDKVLTSETKKNLYEKVSSSHKVA